jgi:hypothetical protein
MTQQFRTNCYADMLNSESVAIAGAQINVYKLLGVYEQTQLINITQNGTAISGGDIPGFPASNAFTALISEWRSKQAGSSSVLTAAYIGYDFGIATIPTGRNRYAVTADERKHISTMAIKQSNNQQNRVTKARVERSDDAVTWYGVQVVNLPDNNSLNTVNFKQSVPARYWRLRPLSFNGQLCDYWGVQALQMMEFAATDITNIQDPILLESRDRNFSTQPITLKGYYQLLTNSVDLTLFGRALPQSIFNIKINFNDCVAQIGRPIVVGDILELPSEAQYTPSLEVVKRYVEVTDVTWDPSSYTPGWMPLMLLITAQPAIASQETQDIFGDLTNSVDSSGLFQGADQPSIAYQDSTTPSQNVLAAADTAVPEFGSEGSNTIREFTDAEIATAAAQGIDIKPIGFNRYGLYVEDAIPQNDAPYTEGPEFPTNPKDGVYHRLTYVGLAQDVPARLYRYSQAKTTWIYMETDKRGLYNSYKKTLQEFTTSPTRTFPDTII